MKNDLSKHFSQFPKKRVLVIGDVMLDEYIGGTADRISPEAPIPVLLQKTVRYILGGAGNVAANVASLGGKVTLLGIVGNDARSKKLRELSREKKIQPKFVNDAKRPTTTKIRFVVGHHQLVRMDIEETRSISGDLENRVIKAIRALPKHDIVIVSDYAKGCITKKVMDELRKKFGASSILADMKPANAHFFKNILAITPNLKEAAELTGIHATNNALADRTAKLLQESFNTSIILTRGEHGVTVLEKTADKPVHFGAELLTVRDVTGAGDTLVAAFALMYSTGVPFVEAAEAANFAAGIVVGVGGTHALTRKEFQKSYDNFTS